MVVVLLLLSLVCAFFAAAARPLLGFNMMGRQRLIPKKLPTDWSGRSTRSHSLVPSPLHAAAASSSSTPAATTLLDQLKQQSLVIADTADLDGLDDAIRGRGISIPEVTTNPSIIWQAASQPKYDNILQEACQSYEDIGKVVEAVAVKFGARALGQLSPPETAKVYTQLDVKLTHDRDGLTREAREVMGMYRSHGVEASRVVLKVPGSWEGICAASHLEKEDNIRCLVTAVTSGPQAVAAAEAGASYVAPYVGRVSDWHEAAARGGGGALPASTSDGVGNKGVQLVWDIQRCYHKRRYRTKVMAASFRNVHQILALAGCDVLTIGLPLLLQLHSLPPIEGGIQPFELSCPFPLEQLESRSLVDKEAFERLLGQDECGKTVFDTSMASFLRDLEHLEHRCQSMRAENPTTIEAGFLGLEWS